MSCMDDRNPIKVLWTKQINNYQYEFISGSPEIAYIISNIASDDMEMHGGSSDRNFEIW